MHEPGCPPGTACRTAHRSDRWAFPSLWHAMPSEASAHFPELVGSHQSPCALPRLAFTLNRGPFPPPALPGFIGTTDLPPPQTARPDPHGSPVGRHVPPPLGFPPLRRSFYACMLSPIPRRNLWVLVSLNFPSGGSLLHFLPGSASASPFSGPAQRSMITACKLAEPLNGPLHRRLRRSRHLL